MSIPEIRKIVLITGAASGIGLSFVKHYLSHPDIIVIACDINEIDTQGFTPNALERLKPHKVDFASESSIQKCIESLATILKHITLPHQPHGIDLVIHSAGIRGLVSAVVNARPDDVAAAETLQIMDSKTMEITYRINSIGTFVLLQSLANLDLFYGQEDHLGRTSKVMIMTSRMGSISYNSTGAGYAYRASKAALNAVVRSLSIDLPYVTFALVHPGRVETGLTRCREEGAIEVEKSVADMLVLLETLSLKDTGRFCDRFGKDIGW